MVPSVLGPEGARRLEALRWEAARQEMGHEIAVRLRPVVVYDPGQHARIRASWLVFVRLPLCPRAKPAAPTDRYTGWALCQVLGPVVE